MKNTSIKPVPLRSVVSELIACYRETSKEKPVQLINNVASDIFILQEGNWLAPLLADICGILAVAKPTQPVLVSAMRANGSCRLYAADSNPAAPHLPTYRVLPQPFRFGFRA